MAIPSGAVARPSRNPLRISGTAMPPNVLFMAKLIVVALVVTNQIRFLPDPFLPFIPGLDHILPGPLFRHALQAVFLVSAVTLFFNYAVRASSLVLGSTILLGVVSSRVYYSNNMTLCALLLILAGLSVRRMQPYMLRMQIAAVYLGAGVNKALDPDWHSGQFFDHWALDALHQPLYIWLHGFFPPLMLGKMMCWFTIVAELATAAMMLTPRLRRYGAGMSVLLQCGFLLFVGDTFNMFFFNMQAAMLCFLDWPEHPMQVIYDGACGFCDWCREQFERLDFDNLFMWLPYQSGAGREFGITDEIASCAVQLVTPRRKVLAGFQAVREILFFNPLLWMATFALIAWGHHRRAIVLLTLLFFTPLVNPIGSLAYGLVARNRDRIFPGRACKVS